MATARMLGRSLVSAYHKWSSDGASLLSAAVAYYLAVAFFPLLMILLSGFGFFLQGTELGQDAKTHILNTVEEQVSPALRNQVEAVLSAVGQNAPLGGPIGIVTLLIAAIAIFVQFDAAFNRIWKTPDQSSRGIWRSVKHVLIVRLKAFFMLLALGGLIIIVFICGMVLSTVESAAGEIISIGEWTAWSIQLLVTFVLNAGVFTLLYRYVPRTEVPWKGAFGGGILAAIIWEIGRQVLSAFVIGKKYSSAYGVVGAFLAIMLWGYYAISVVFFGAEYAQTLNEKFGDA